MIKKFECLKCKHQFEADDLQEVLCPVCHSDNIRPYKKGYVSYVLMAVAFCIVVGASFWITKSCRDNKKQEDEVVVENDVTETTIADTAANVDDVLPVVTDVHNPVAVKLVSFPKYDKQSRTYSFKVSAIDVPSDAEYHFELLDEFDVNKIISLSKDGIFSGVKPTKSGIYQVRVVGNTQKLDCEPFTISGCVEVKEVPKGEKMSASKLQSLINAQDGSLLGGNKAIAPNCAIHCSNLRSGDKSPSSFSAVFEKLIFEWQSVAVINVGYDDMNRINSISLSPTYQE